VSQRLETLLKSSRLCYYVGRHARLLRAKVPTGAAVPAPYYPENLETDSSHWSVFRVPYTPRFEAAFRVTEALLAAVRDSCAARGIPLLLFAYPQKVEVDAQARASELHHYGYDPRQFDLAAPYVRLQALADHLDVPFVYPLDLFRQEEIRRPLFFARDGHPNAVGNALAAQVLEQAVRDLLERVEAPHHAQRG